MDDLRQKIRSQHLKTQEVCGYLGEGEGEVSRGFIAPFNAQVNLARSIIPESVVKNTIHKFQGRGCDGK